MNRKRITAAITISATLAFTSVGTQAHSSGATAEVAFLADTVCERLEETLSQDLVIPDVDGVTITLEVVEPALPYAPWSLSIGRPKVSLFTCQMPGPAHRASDLASAP